MSYNNSKGFRVEELLVKITSHTHVDEQLAKEIRRLENNIKEYEK